MLYIIYCIIKHNVTIKPSLLPYQYEWILTCNIKCLMFFQLLVAGPEYITFVEINILKTD